MTLLDQLAKHHHDSQLLVLATAPRMHVHLARSKRSLLLSRVYDHVTSCPPGPCFNKHASQLLAMLHKRLVWPATLPRQIPLLAGLDCTGLSVCERPRA